MTDDHLTTTTTIRPAEPPAARRGPLLRPLLWLLLVLSLTGSVVVSSLRVPALVELPIGLVGVGCVAGLVLHHYRVRR
jgi:hypothetical protein